jgi:AraC family transcriptional regulator
MNSEYSAIISDPDTLITEIAMRYMFSGPAVFSRIFRNRFGMSPSEWRNGGWKEYSKNSKLQSSRYQHISKESKELSVNADYTLINNKWSVIMKSEKTNLEYTVEIKQVEKKHIAYVRHTGPYAGDSALFEKLFTKLMKWAGPRNLFIPGKTEMLTIYHDSPEITDEDKLRISVCITVPKGTETGGDVGYIVMDGGKYAAAEFRIDIDQYGDAWNTVFGDWLPESGYQCSDGPCFELYLNDPSKEPDGKHHIAIYIPIKEL